MLTKKILNIVLLSIPAVTTLIVWQVFIIIKPEYEFFLGAPLGIFKETLNLLIAGTLLKDLAITSIESLLGFAFGSLIGTYIGLLLWFSKTIYKIAKPYIITLGSVPVFALGPILIFWFGTGIFSKIVLGFLSTLVIAIVQSYNGAEQSDKNLQKLLTVFGANRYQIFTKIIIPSSFIWVLAGIRINIGMALLGAFVGEFMASKMGLGNLIMYAQALYNVNQIWVGILGIILIALMFNSMTSPIEKWAKRWQ